MSMAYSPRSCGYQVTGLKLATGLNWTAPEVSCRGQQRRTSQNCRLDKLK